MSDDKQVAERKPIRELQAVQSAEPMFDTAQFEHFQRAAQALAHSTLLPPVIRGESDRECFSNLMMVFDIATRWGVPALTIAQCIGIAYGKVVFEGKLIAAVLESKLGIDLDYEWHGKPSDGMAYGITVSATIPGQSKVKSVEGTVGEWHTLDKQGRMQNNWTGANATAQLAYRGARQWCRLYRPAIILGIYSMDEIEEIRGDNFGHVTLKPVTLEKGFAGSDATSLPPAMLLDPSPSVLKEPPAPTTEEPEPEPEKKPEPEKQPEKPQDAQETEKAPDAPDAGETAPAPSADKEKPAAKKKPAAKAKEPPAEATDQKPTLDPALEEYPGLATFCKHLGSKPTWEAIKASVVDIAATDGWRDAGKQPGTPALVATRRAIYAAAMALEDAPDIISDMTLFRCWIEAAEFESELLENAERLKGSDIWETLNAGQQRLLTGSITRRIKELENE